VIIYRPHRGSLVASLSEKEEFSFIEEMKIYIEEQFDGYVKAEDVVLYGEIMNEKTTGWKDCQMVCVKAFNGEDYIAKYGCPQCIGYYATDYK